jgi:hypothetical protein
MARFSLAALFLLRAASALTIVPNSLKTDGLVDPITVATTTPRLAWLLSPAYQGESQKSYQIQVASSVERLQDPFASADLWDSGIVHSSDNTALYDGSPLKSRQAAYWRVRVFDSAPISNPSAWSAPASFEISLLHASDWSASWIGNNEYVTGVNGLPLFAKSFSTTCSVEKARLYLLGLGLHAATLNGQPVDDSILAPGYSVFNKTLRFNTYDVTSLISGPGSNLLGVELGKGDYDAEKGLDGRYMQFTVPPRQLMLTAQLEYVCKNGKSYTIVSDDTWQTTATGPRLESAWYGGEEYDARRELSGWPRKVQSSSGWKNANITTPPTGKLVSATYPALKIIDTVSPVSTTQVNGSWVFDFGVNFAGWFEVTVDEPAETRIVGWVGEELDNGLVSQSSTSGPIFDGYTSNGKSGKWSRKFMYSGFQYLQVNFTQPPAPGSVVGHIIRSSVDSVGSLSTSNPLLNSIHKIIDRSVQSNIYSTLTDCPHREKQGWLEQDHLVIDIVTQGYDMESHYPATIQNMMDAQYPSGLVPDMAPEYIVFTGGYQDDPNWGSTMVLLPYAHYKAYGDIRVLQNSYPAMQAYVEYLTNKSVNYTLNYGLGDWESLEVKPEPAPSKGITATYGWYEAVIAMISMAGYLGKHSDVATYTALSKNIASGFNTAFFNTSTSAYALNTQCDNILALDMGVVPSDVLPSVVNSLVANLKYHNTTWQVGEVAHPALFRVLLNNGQNDLLWQLMNTTDFPSYGYEVELGATSLWEHWDSQGPNNSGGSLNHFMFGYGDVWLRLLSGLSQAPDSVAWASINYAPMVIGDLTSASATYRTIKGMASASWSLSGKSLKYDIIVPVGSTGTVTLDYSKITESGLPIIKGLRGVTGIKTSAGTTTITVGSGSYRFVASK